MRRACYIVVTGSFYLGMMSSTLWGQGIRPVTETQNTRPQPQTGQPGGQLQPRPPVQTENASQSKIPRPPAQQLVVEPVPPELERLLKVWEVESSKIKSIHGEHFRWVYNSVFQVEKRSAGRFFYESPDKGRIDMTIMKAEANEKSSKTGPDGKPYRIEPDNPQKWICTGKEILTISDQEKSYEVFPVPPDFQGTKIIHGPLPFLFGMKAEEAKRRYKLKLIKEDQDKAIIQAEPRLEMDAVNYKTASIILDKSRYIPLAVKLIDQSGNLETVYSFNQKKIVINGEGFREKLKNLFSDNDPFHPDLRSYKLVQQPVNNGMQHASGNKETGGIKQTSGQATDKVKPPPASNFGTGKIPNPTGKSTLK